MCNSGFNETDVCTCICIFCEGTLTFLPHPLKRSAGKTSYCVRMYIYFVYCTVHSMKYITLHTQHPCT